MRFYFVVFIAVILSGCGSSKYAVKQITDEFSAPSGPLVYTVEKNSVDMHDPLGVVTFTEIRPSVHRDRETGKVVGVWISLERVAREFDAPHWLFVRKGDELVFLLDGERFAIKSTGRGSTDHYTEANSTGVHTDYYEHAIYEASPAVVKAIGEADDIKIKAYGARGSAVWPDKGNDMLSSFSANFLRFYREEIEPYL